MDANTIMNWIGTAFTVAGAAVAFATVVVGLTPTQKDDAILAKVVKVLNWLSVVNPRKGAPKPTDYVGPERLGG